MIVSLFSLYRLYLFVVSDLLFRLREIFVILIIRWKLVWVLSVLVRILVDYLLGMLMMLIFSLVNEDFFYRKFEFFFVVFWIGDY